MLRLPFRLTPRFYGACYLFWIPLFGILYTVCSADFYAPYVSAEPTGIEERTNLERTLETALREQHHLSAERVLQVSNLKITGEKELQFRVTVKDLTYGDIIASSVQSFSGDGQKFDFMYCWVVPEEDSFPQSSHCLQGTRVSWDISINSEMPSRRLLGAKYFANQPRVWGAGEWLDVIPLIQLPVRDILSTYDPPPKAKAPEPSDEKIVVPIYGTITARDTLLYSPTSSAKALEMERLTEKANESLVLTHKRRLFPIYGTDGTTTMYTALAISGLDGLRPDRGDGSTEDLLDWDALQMDEADAQVVANVFAAAHGNASVSGQFLRMLYLSVVIITTLGLGDIVPLTTLARGLVGTEAIIGPLFAGLFLNALAKDISNSTKKSKPPSEPGG